MNNAIAIQHVCESGWSQEECVSKGTKIGQKCVVCGSGAVMDASKKEAL